MLILFRRILSASVACVALVACHPSASYDSKQTKYDSALPAKLSAADTMTGDAHSDHLSTFVLPGYTLLDSASGDLNLDNYPDEILVLKKDGEDSSSDVVEHPEKRPLLILTGTHSGHYTLSARCDNAVYCVDCGGMMGDPFTGISIKKGYFSVEHYGGSGERWTRIITFRFSPSDNHWYLYKDGGDSFYASDPEKSTTNVRTVKDFGKITIEQFNVYKDE